MNDAAHTPLPPVPPPRRSWWKAFVLTTVVFGAGTIVGAILAAYAMWQHQVDAAHQPRFQGARIVRQLDRRFDLSEEQRLRIESIVREHHMRLEQIRGETEPRVHDVFQSMQQHIAAELTPEQRQFWERRVQRMNDRWMRPDRGPRQRREHDGATRREGERMRGRLHAADENRDGVFTFEELSRAIPDLDERRFRHMDDDDDGFVSFDEFHRARQMHPPPPPRDSDFLPER